MAARAGRPPREPRRVAVLLSLEDQLLRGLQSRLWSAVPERIRQRADATPLNSIQVRLIEEVQRDAEQADAQRRRDWLAVEEVENAQRVEVYSLRPPKRSGTDPRGRPARQEYSVTADKVMPEKDVLDELRLWFIGREVGDVDLSIVRFASGSGDLGPWGSLRLTGASSAVIKATNCEDIELPSPAAEDLPGGVAVLNEAKGRLLFLPDAGEIVAGFDLAAGRELFPPITIPRDQDAGMRLADYRLGGIGGIVY